MMTDKKLRIYSIMIVVIILISVAGNMIYASNQVIPQPLFTEFNKETVYSKTFDETLYISYITNNNDERRLDSISFEGLESVQPVSQTNYFGGFVFNNDVGDNPYNDTIGRYYTLKRAYVDLRLTEEEIVALEKGGSLTFGSGTAILDDGTSLEMSIGRYTIYSQEYWNAHRLRTGGGGSDDYFDVDFETKTPIQINSIDLSTFSPHKDALNMELIVDNNQVYTYEDLMAISPIQVDRKFQVVFTADDHEVSSQWRFNMMSMDMTYTKEGQTYDTWIYYPFSGSGMDEASVEAYVELWRSENE